MEVGIHHAVGAQEDVPVDLTFPSAVSDTVDGSKTNGEYSVVILAVSLK